MKAKGFCTCKRDFPQRTSFHPPANATWHYLCDRPVLPKPSAEETMLDGPWVAVSLEDGTRTEGSGALRWGPASIRIVPTGTGWPVP